MEKEKNKTGWGRSYYQSGKMNKESLSEKGVEALDRDDEAPEIVFYKKDVKKAVKNFIEVIQELEEEKYITKGNADDLIHYLKEIFGEKLNKNDM